MHGVYIPDLFSHTELENSDDLDARTQHEYEISPTTQGNQVSILMPWFQTPTYAPDQPNFLTVIQSSCSFYTLVLGDQMGHHMTDGIMKVLISEVGLGASSSFNGERLVWLESLTKF